MNRITHTRGPCQHLAREARTLVCSWRPLPATPVLCPARGVCPGLSNSASAPSQEQDGRGPGLPAARGSAPIHPPHTAQSAERDERDVSPHGSPPESLQGNCVNTSSPSSRAVLARGLHALSTAHASCLVFRLGTHARECLHVWSAGHLVPPSGSTLGTTSWRNGLSRR